MWSQHKLANKKIIFVFKYKFFLHFKNNLIVFHPYYPYLISEFSININRGKKINYMIINTFFYRMMRFFNLLKKSKTTYKKNEESMLQICEFGHGPELRR